MRIYVIFLVICFCNLGSNNNEAEIKGINPNKIKLPEKGLCAHRGAMETHPENTLIAFREAVKAGAHMIELDVQLTKDKELVIMHDLTVDRTTDGEGKVSELTLAEIKKLDAGSYKSPGFSGEPVPTFMEALNVMPDNIWLNVHLKGDGELVASVIKILLNENRLHQAFLACGKESAKLARQIYPEIMICNMDRKPEVWDYVQGTIDMEADFIQLKDPITPEFPKYTRELKKHGIRINYYGTDSPEEIQLLYEYGVDFPLVNDIVNSIHIAADIGLVPAKPLFR